MKRLGKYVVPLAWSIVSVIIAAASALVCWECDSVKQPDCGRYFRSGNFKPKVCDEDETCALQRQETPGEIFAILRDCYRPNLIPGLNSTNGCRNFTTVDRAGSYTALYCFCDTMLCNSAPSRWDQITQTRIPFLWLTFILQIVVWFHR